MNFPRLHLFEFEDLRWLPKVFRRCITDLLTYQMNKLGIYDAAAPKIIEMLDKTGHTTIVDLCSGSGGPSLRIREKASNAMGKEISLFLTDKFPNQEAFAAINEKSVTPVQESVDALQVSNRFKGFRTLFTAFHHFKPRQAQSILKNAVDEKMPIGVFEITERKPVSLMTLIIAPITCLVFSLMIRPFKVSRIFWTFLVPVIPILYTWDGLISNVRTYTKEEWLEMANQLGDDYTWETGEMISKFHIKVSYLIGHPKKQNVGVLT